MNLIFTPAADHLLMDLKLLIGLAKDSSTTLDALQGFRSAADWLDWTP